VNNPLIYTDPSGEFWHLVVGALIGGVANWATHGAKFNAKGLGYFGVGAAAGALGAGIGAGISSAMAGGGFGAGFMGSSAAMTATSSFLSGAAIGGGAGFTSGFVTGFGNALVEKQSFGKSIGQGFTYGGIGLGSGILLGGITGGINAAKDGRNFWHGGRLTTDVSMPLPQMNQAPGTEDCRYETFRSIDEYYNGSTSDVADLRNNFSNVETKDAMMSKMYSSRGLGMRDFAKENITSQMTKSDIAYKIANTMTANKAMVYEMNISKGIAHATAITRVRIYDNGKILINLMNPSGAGGYSISNFRNMRNIFSIFKF
jgi:hypothetical protein